jgi:hypothetical protein
MTTQDGDFVAGRGVPNAGGLIIRCRDDASSVGAEGGRIYIAIMPAKDRDFLARRGVPDASCLVK